MAGKKILIVEDDQDVLLGLSVRLKKNGYAVVSASDAVLAASVAVKEEPDLVILDIGLPGGDGFLVMERLKSCLPKLIPIVVLSARDPVTSMKRAFEAGAACFIQKPADNDKLLSTILKALVEPKRVPR